MCVTESISSHDVNGKVLGVCYPFLCRWFILLGRICKLDGFSVLTMCVFNIPLDGLLVFIYHEVQHYYRK